MSRLAAITTTAERSLLVLTAAVVLTVHLGGILAPDWLVQIIPLGEDLRPLLPAAQLIMLAAWTILGPGPLWMRLPAAPVLLLLWAMVWTSLAASVADATGTLPLTAGIAAAIFALAIRCCGIRQAIDASPATAKLRHPQFSIRGLIVLTTLIAAGLGILEWLRPLMRSEQDLSRYLEGLIAARLEGRLFVDMASAASVRQYVLGAGMAMISATALWCILRPGAMWLRLVVTAIIAPLFGVYLANLTGDREASVSLAIGLTALAAVVGVSVLPLRLSGLRLERKTASRRVPITTKQCGLQTCPPKFVPETAS
jgi:hypothetical protein